MALGRFLFSREFKSIQYRKIPVFHLQNRTVKIHPVKSKNPLKNQGICGRYLFHRPFMAQREGFEPPETLVSTVFKTAAIDHSTISACFTYLLYLNAMLLSIKNAVKSSKRRFFSWGIARKVEKNGFVEKNTPFLQKDC